MPLEGDLSIFRLPDILQVIAQQKKTGILTVQGESDILAVSFSAGDVVAADALNQGFEEMLGEVLASQGILPPERFSKLSEEHRGTAGERLADFLIRRGALTREQLLGALRFQTYRLLLEVLRWKEGEFKFYGGEEVAFEEGMEPLTVEEVLYRSMRDMLGAGTMAGAMPHGFLPYERVAPDRPIRVARESIPPQERESGVLWISADEWTLLDRLDGETPAEQIGRETGLGDLRTQYALFHLLRSGLVRPAGNADEPAAAPPVPATPPRVERAPPRPAPSRMPPLERTSPAAGVPVERPPSPPPRPRTPSRPVPVPVEVTIPAAEVPAGVVRAAAVLAAALGIFVLTAALLRPEAVLLPYPSQRPAREGLARIERQARFAAIDRAARRFYLLEGRYPASLEDLVARSLLAERQLFDTRGSRLVLRPDADTYTLTKATSRAGGSPPEALESVAGDVLLDRTLFVGVQDETGVPLVLLD